MGPGALIQLGLNSLLPEEIAESRYIENAPFKETWIYILITFVMGIIQFLLLLHRDSKIYELKEKKVYLEKSEEDGNQVGKKNNYKIFSYKTQK